MKISETLLLFVLVKLFLFATLINGSNDNERKPYIVYMGELPEDTTSLVDEHHNLLAEAIGDVSMAKEHKIHSYGRSFNGFVARLLPQEANKLKHKENVVSVFPNTVRKLRTTRSWDFLGMPQTVKRNHGVESNLIVALLDTGVWPNSPSFDDKGFGPPPRKWKGKCATGHNFTGCNNKVIGATYYDVFNMVNDPSPVDEDGHGSHTASTAAGVPVDGASLYGIAEGTARGGMPSARIAMYKVCWGVGCQDADLLAAFDVAIGDGVDVISISIGGPASNFFEDPIAIGAFHAMRKGILTSSSAGNDGPWSFTVENTAPWMMTIAASSIDRQLQTGIKLGNGETINGVSINTFSPEKTMYSLTDGPHAINVTTARNGNVSACDYGTLSERRVKGKIVLCLGAAEELIDDLNGAGTIMSLDMVMDTAYSFVIPAALVDVKAGQQIENYINSTKNPTAVIHKTRGVKMTAPFVASFSARGPQFISRNILKPDIAAPGLSILAAYSEMTSVTGMFEDNRYVKYNILSGTSMACPHAASAAAYVKSFHPRWSPAAIKSALMTTATPMKIKTEDAELASGSGQINPRAALHPGLVYDVNMYSYVGYLCKEGYNATVIGMITGSRNKYNCSSVHHGQGTDGLNYPSIHHQLTNPNSSISAVFYRTVTNVGYGKAVYKAKVNAPAGLSVEVIPSTLTFERSYQKRSFQVLLKGKFIDKNSRIHSASLVWSDSKHTVTSPIIVYKPLPDDF